MEPELEQRLERAARVRGESVSEFIRVAAAERADATLTDSDVDGFDDVIGVIHGGGGRARHTGEAFTEIVAGRASRS